MRDITFEILDAKGRLGIYGSRTKFALLTIIWLKTISWLGAGRLRFLTKITSSIPNSGQHDFELDGFEMLQVVVFVEGTRIDRITSSFSNVEQENCWKMQAKVIMATEKKIMVFPPGGNF